MSIARLCAEVTDLILDNADNHGVIPHGEDLDSEGMGLTQPMVAKACVSYLKNHRIRVTNLLETIPILWPDTKWVVRSKPDDRMLESEVAGEKESLVTWDLTFSDGSSGLVSTFYSKDGFLTFYEPVILTGDF